MLQYIVPATGLLFTLENILWINIGVFVGSVFAAIPGLSVILCVILFLPVTYTMTAIPGMMFLLGIYCAGGYGGSVSAILINTPGTPHAAATMLDGHPLSRQGRTKAALKIALYASTFGGVFSALMLLFLGPQVAKIAAQLGTLFDGATEEELLYDAQFDKDHQVATTDGYHTDSGFQAAINLTKLAGGITGDPTADQIFDESFLDKAWENLGQ